MWPCLHVSHEGNWSRIGARPHIPGLDQRCLYALQSDLREVENWPRTREEADSKESHRFEQRKPMMKRLYKLLYLFVTYVYRSATEANATRINRLKRKDRLVRQWGALCH